MHFSKLILLFILLQVTNTITAQFKLSSSFGLSNKMQNTTDSTQFGKKTGRHIQLNAAYYIGRVGVGINVANVQHNAIKNFENTDVPNFGTQAIKGSVNSGGIKAIVATIGPELCLCYKKLKIIPTIKIGLAFLKNDTTKIVFENIATAARYNITPETNSSIAIQAGTIIAFKVSRHLGIAFNSMLTGYNIKQLVVDSRTGTTPKSITQPNRLLHAGLGAYYNF